MASKNDLTVLTVVENDNGTLDLMIKSVRKFTNPHPKFIICDNSNGTDKVLDKYKNDSDISIVKNVPKMSGGSNRHGEGLNKIFPLVSTARTAIVESDCIVLCDNWDDIDFPKYKMVAAKKGELAGQPYYHVCFMIFSTGLLKHDNLLDFRAGQDNNRGNRTYKPHEDVGWRLRDKIRFDQVQLLDFVDCKEGSGRFFDNRFQSDEFWLNGNPIVAHFGRGSNVGGKAVRKGFAHPSEQLVEWKEIAQEIIK